MRRLLQLALLAPLGSGCGWASLVPPVTRADLGAPDLTAVGTHHLGIPSLPSASDGCTGSQCSLKRRKASA